MALLSTIEAVRSRVVVGNEFRLKNVEIMLPDVYNDFFRLILGKLLYDEIAGYNSETGVKKEAFNHLESAAAKLIIYKYLVKGQVLIEDTGVNRLETEHSKTAYKNQIKDLRELYFEEAYSSIELLIEVISANPGSFTNWNTAPVKTDQSKLLVKTASSFNEMERLNRKHITFYSLIPVQKQAIDLYLKSRFTATLINELIANTGLTDEKKALLDFLSKALTNFTIAIGMEKNMVHYSVDGISLLLHDKDTASELKSKADLNAIQVQINRYYDTGHRYMALAEKYVSDNTTEIEGEDTEPFEKKQPWL